MLDLGCGGARCCAELLEASRRSPRSSASTCRRGRWRSPPGGCGWTGCPSGSAARVTLLQSALTYPTTGCAGYDAAVLMEVIEHVDPPGCPRWSTRCSAHAAPGTVVVTTPNVEYNVRYEALPAGAMRHRDHRFEWTRARVRAPGRDGVARPARLRASRSCRVGADDPEVGPPTQMAVFTRARRAE